MSSEEVWSFVLEEAHADVRCHEVLVGRRLIAEAAAIPHISSLPGLTYGLS